MQKTKKEIRDMSGCNLMAAKNIRSRSGPGHFVGLGWGLKNFACVGVFGIWYSAYQGCVFLD
jgi:hypothetical protein